MCWHAFDPSQFDNCTNTSIARIVQILTIIVVLQSNQYLYIYIHIHTQTALDTSSASSTAVRASIWPMLAMSFSPLKTLRGRPTRNMGSRASEPGFTVWRRQRRQPGMVTICHNGQRHVDFHATLRTVEVSLKQSFYDTFPNQPWSLGCLGCLQQLAWAGNEWQEMAGSVT